jgi:hypothetical protein
MHFLGCGPKLPLTRLKRKPQVTSRSSTAAAGSMLSPAQHAERMLAAISGKIGWMLVGPNLAALP